MRRHPVGDVGLGPVAAKRRSSHAVRPDSPGRPADSAAGLDSSGSATLSKAGITWLAEVLCVQLLTMFLRREGARIFVMGALPSGCGFSPPVAGNQQLIRASARILELVLEGDSRWLEAPSSGSTQIRVLASSLLTTVVPTYSCITRRSTWTATACWKRTRRWNTPRARVPRARRRNRFTRSDGSACGGPPPGAAPHTRSCPTVPPD